MNEQQYYVLTHEELEDLVDTATHWRDPKRIDDYTKVSGNTSDGYHTFDELYEHRNTLFCSLVTCSHHKEPFPVECFWSKKHSDGSMFSNYIIVGLAANHGYVTYHMDEKFIKQLPEKIEVEFAPEWDGHTSNDVLDRLQEYFTP